MKMYEYKRSRSSFDLLSRSHDQYGHHAHTCMIKAFKNLLLQNQLTDGLEIWYVALGNQVLPWLLK